jgi:hypothetical protein
LEQPWLVRYQFYLFVFIKGSYRLQATSCKLMSGTPEASSLQPAAKFKEGL